MPVERDESGIIVYPRLPVPSRRSSDPRRGGKGPNRRVIALVAGSLIAGGTGVWFLQPAIAPDPRVAAANKRANEATHAASTLKERADSLEKQLDAASRGKRDADARLATAEAAQSQLAGKVTDETSQRKAAELVQTRLKGAIDRATGAITIDGDEVHLQIADRALFKPNDDALTDRGKLVLGKIAAALKDLPDKLVWVQGHTDEAPGAKGRDAAKSPAGRKAARPVASPRFPTSWELSAARALAVVHHLQDVGKLDPGRLAALAFGSYAPVASKDRAASRRIEIVVMSRRPAAR